MIKLYHGSGYDQDELMPGFKRSGKIVRWDKTESNEWLYVSSTMEEAIAMGLASVIEKTYNIARYNTSGNEITIEIEHGRIPTPQEIERTAVYLYTIAYQPEVWVKVGNAHNGSTTEYKTKETIKDAILSKEQIDLKTWLSRKTLKIVPPGSISSRW